MAFSRVRTARAKVFAHPVTPPRTTLSLHAYLAQDRRRALARGLELPECCSGAALFADITGFTALTETLAQGQGSRRGVDDVVRRINAVHQVLIDEVERCGGSVVSLAGDGMTCWFDDRDAGPEPGGSGRKPAGCRPAAGCGRARRGTRSDPRR